MKASGRLLLRLPPTLHGYLRQTAKDEGISLNEHCVRRLSAPPASFATDLDALPLLSHAHEMFDEQLVGLLLYGSWVRNEATKHSDVDALVVVERDVELTRSLYRAWDAQPLTWAGRVLDVHFAHLPIDALPAGGVWAEAAIDGRVLFEQDHRITDQLQRVRRAIADGRLVRRSVHGQSYWTTAA